MKNVVQTNIVDPQSRNSQNIKSSIIIDYKDYNYDFLKYDYIKEPNAKSLIIANYLYNIQENRYPFFSKMISSRDNDYYINSKFS